MLFLIKLNEIYILNKKIKLKNLFNLNYIFSIQKNKNNLKNEFRSNIISYL